MFYCLGYENSYYSVITPEGCAAILFRDASRASQAASALKITATDLEKLGVVDEIIPEPLGGAHRDLVTTAKNIKQTLLKYLSDLKKLNPLQLEEDRYMKYRKLGIFKESTKKAVKAERKTK